MMAYGVILGLNAEEGNADGEHGVGGCGVAVVCTFGGIAPGWALQSTVSNVRNRCSVSIIAILRTGQTHASS
jgi:hypothetical protein